MILIPHDSDKDTRLDAFVAKASELSRSAAAKLIENGSVTVNGEASQKKYQIKPCDVIELIIPTPSDTEVLPENIPLNIVYEDSELLVINKPSGMVVHPAPGNYTGTLVNALLFHCKNSLSGIGGVLRPGIVHRIDKDTSGLLVVAKNDKSHLSLSRELEHHGIVREYHALVRGGFKNDTGTVDAPIGRHPVDRKKMAVILGDDKSKKDAVTHYEVLERFGGISHLRLILETGRTHQIRVHMAYIGHPLLGDEVYQGTKTSFEKQHPRLFDGQALHARRLSFTHPKTNEKMSFDAPLPENFERALEILRNSEKE